MNTDSQNIDELKRINYEISIWLLTVLSVFNLVIYLISPDLAVKSVVLRVSLLLCVVFFLDFLHRLRTADSKRKYFIKQYGWMDLLGSIPILPWANLARLMRLVRTTRAFRVLGGRKLLFEVLSNRADTALLLIFLCVIFLLEFGSIAILKAEVGAPGATILNAGDAFWWVIVTIATVGYGDEYPVTEAGRSVGVILIVAGVAVFGTLSGYLANSFLGQDTAQNKSSSIKADDLLVELKALRQENADLRQMQEQTHADIQVLKSVLSDSAIQTDTQSK